MNKLLIKGLALAVMTAGLSACGSDSKDDSEPKDSAVFNLSADPSFTFDQTTYVGAVDPAATTEWYSFAMAGSYPATAAEVDLSNVTTSSAFNPNVTFEPSMAGITPASECPSGAGTYQITDASDDVTIDGKTFKKCTLSGSILENLSLANDVVWRLSGRVNVGDGNRTLTVGDSDVRDVTLTVASGTVFHSATGSSLVVTRGAKIIAEGTAAQPIVFAGEATDTYGEKGEWGGLVLQGFGYDNKCGDPEVETICNQAGEGASGMFGGFDNADNSGSLKYVIVAEAGSELSNGDELNGIGFMGVGYGTNLDYIQVHNNVDDGVELWGGAANLTHLVLTSINDDSIDWDEGYVGNIQYALIVQTANQAKTSNHAFELDTKGDAAESAFQESNPTVANVTAIASLDDTDLDTANSNVFQGNGINLKDGSEGRFFNTVLLGDYTNCVYIKDETSYKTDAAAQAAFVNVYGLCDTSVEDNRGGSAAVEIEAGVATLSDTLAYTGSVTATIASVEVDGSAPAQ